MNMNLKGILPSLGAKPGQVVSNPYARAFAPQPTIKEAEGEDHEVSMANNSIDTIIKMATELKAKMGEDEKEIPAWIQDHISKAENYISQAANNYHEYGTTESVNEGQLSNTWQKNNKKGYVLKVGNIELKSEGPTNVHDIFVNRQPWGTFHMDYESGGVYYWVQPLRGDDFYVQEIDDIVKRVKKFVKNETVNEGKTTDVIRKNESLRLTKLK